MADQTVDVNLLIGHYILCGAGRTGQSLVAHFCELRLPLAVIDQDAEVLARVRHKVAQSGASLVTILGDATEDETLERAGITSARGLVAALSHDKDNLFTTLAARALNPALRIVARVDDEANNREKLEKAGANKVISTEAIGGMRMASEMVRPEVVRFLDQMARVRAKDKTLRFTELPLSKIIIPELAELIQASRHPGSGALQIKDIGRYTGLLVVAVKPAREQADDSAAGEAIYQIKKRYRFAPRGDTELHHDDILMVIGTQDKLEEVTGSHPGEK